MADTLEFNEIYQEVKGSMVSGGGGASGSRAGRRCGIAGAWEERRDQLWDRPWSRGAGLDAGSVERLKTTGFGERGLMKSFW